MRALLMATHLTSLKQKPPIGFNDLLQSRLTLRKNTLDELLFVLEQKATNEELLEGPPLLQLDRYIITKLDNFSSYTPRDFRSQPTVLFKQCINEIYNIL